MVNIDTSLFVDAASRGYADGNKYGTPFSNFANSFVTGLQQEQKNEEQRQQNIIRQNQIDNIDVENRIKENVADKGDAELAAYRDDPAAFLENQKRKQEFDAQKAQDEQKALIKKQQFQEIIQSKDGAAIGAAIVSGQYNDVVPAATRKQIETDTFSTWPEDLQNQRLEQGRAARAAALREENAIAREKNAEKTIEDFANNGTFNRIKDLAKNEDGTQIDEDTFMRKGRVGYVNIYEDKLGAISTDPNTLIGELKRTRVKTFIIDDKPVMEDGYPVTVDETDEKLFDKRKGLHISRHAQEDSDLEDQKKASQAQRDAQKAEQERLSDPDYQAEQRKNFYGGVEPGYQNAAKRVEEEIRSNTRPPPTVTPNSTTYEARPGNATPAPALTPNPTPTPGATDAPPASKRKQALAEAKAREMLKRKAPAGTATPAPTSSGLSLVPEAQAEELPPSPRNAFEVAQVPKMTVNTTVKPATGAVARIKSIPEAKGLSAFTKAIMAAESSGITDAKSPTGVPGLMQVTEGLAKDINPGAAPDRADPFNSIMYGAINIETVMQQFDRNPILAAIAYNGGPGVAAEAVRLAGGSTDWAAIKRVLPQAVRAFKESEWDPKGINTEDKVKEVMAYPERVIVNFPEFVTSNRDMEIATNLREQGLLTF